VLLRAVVVILFFFIVMTTKAQHSEIPIIVEKSRDSTYADSKVSSREVDLSDVWSAAFRKKKHQKENISDTIKKKELLISALPAIGYSLQTKFAIAGILNGAFYTSKSRKENISSVLMNITYSQNKQILFPIQSNIWTKGNKYNLYTDWRYLKFPSTTYGLGGNTRLSDGYLMDYSYLRFYQTLLRSIAPNWYAGLGYDLDYYWNIKEINPPVGVQTDLQKYGLTKRATASGTTLNLKYDNRKNSINPENGYFASLTYRSNFTFIGSDASWQSIVLDLRKYNKLPFSSKNILAFWGYVWLTPGGGKPTYMLLPSTGNDVNNNSGRGYIQGRFRSKNMLYLESEYRFGITNNGLVGGVVFVNAQSFSDKTTEKFQTVYLGWGAGLRLKVNKYSRTNIAIDYGFGEGGSRGFFVNLGELF
jgi:outer membrane protein assembly factor BamA